jgi:hypothetical protein
MPVACLLSASRARESTFVAGRGRNFFNEGWVLLGVYPLTTLGEMTEGKPREEGKRQQPQDTQRYVRRFVGYVVGRRREV